MNQDWPLGSLTICQNISYMYILYIKKVIILIALFWRVITGLREVRYVFPR